MSIYDSHDVQTFRRPNAPSKTLTLVDGTIAVLTPEDALDAPETSVEHEAALDRWHSALIGGEGAAATTTLGQLLVWASKRPPFSELGPGDDDVMFAVHRAALDPQRAHHHAFNRRCVREALQPMVERGVPASEELMLYEWLDEQPERRTPMLRIDAAGVSCWLAGLAASVATGDDPMPVQWSAQS